jgi:hypothetical protein
MTLIDRILSFLWPSHDRETREKRLEDTLQFIMRLCKISLQMLYVYVFLKLFISLVLRRRSTPSHSSVSHVPTISHVTKNPYKFNERMDSTHNVRAAYDQVVDYYGHYTTQTGLPTFPEFLVDEETQLERLVRRPTQQSTRRRR